MYMPGCVYTYIYTLFPIILTIYTNPQKKIETNKKNITIYDIF